MKRSNILSSLLAATTVCLGAGLLGATPAKAITILDFEKDFNNNTFTTNNNQKAKKQFWNLGSNPDLEDWYRADYGVTLSGSNLDGSFRHLSLYNSEANGEDSDLLTNAALNSDLAGTTAQGNVLILQEGTNAKPDDNANGGIFGFDFDTAIKAQSITMLDIGDGNPSFDEVTFKLFDTNGSEVLSQTAQDFFDNSLVTTVFKKAGTDHKSYDNSIYEFDLSQVYGGDLSRIEVVNQGSGAIAGLKWNEGTPKVPEPISLLAPLTIGAIATEKALKKSKSA